jgi:cysteine desulfurase family protein (TIGR01976 family)
MKPFDVGFVRAQFPALARTVNGHPVAFLDGPGGTQTPARVIGAVSDYLLNHNCNVHGVFATSQETDEIVYESRRAVADLLGCHWKEVSFGSNMTTLTIFMAQSLVRGWKPDDEVVITALDHEANRGPWLHLQERGIRVHEVPVNLDNFTLDWEAFEGLVNERTRLVAIGYASNAVGTINDVKRASSLAHAVGALCWVDAVHFALHGLLDVRDIDCDFLVCSPYKFFGPHLGVLYVRESVSETVRPLKLGTQKEEPPFRFETGTLCHEGIAGTGEAVEFIAEVGRHHTENGKDLERRAAVCMGMRAIEAYERPLATHLIDRLSSLPRVRMSGPPAGHPRTSTVSFVIDGCRPREIALELGKVGLFVWDGDFYASRLMELTGLAAIGGLVRVGLCPYNTSDEVERLFAAVS